MSVRLGVDVGGTFTDFLVADDATGRVLAWKTPSTRPDPSAGIFAGIEALVAQGALRGEALAAVTVGNTVALNAILERKGASTALLVTKGFKDILEIGRERRRLLYDLQQEKLPALVPRRLRLEVDERLNAQGEVLRPLDLDGVRALLTPLRDEGVESIAVCLLHAYANPAHEQAIVRLVQEEFPALSVSASHTVLRQYREYERALITTLNAYVMPVMRRYLDGLQAGVERLNRRARLYVTHSAGGVMSVPAARDRVINTTLSGPAAGVRGAAFLAACSGHADFITMDMGGTSCDVAVMQRGTPQMAAHAALGDYPVPLRTIDIKSISAGGGTIAWVDEGGLLRVGPQSTGSAPGPACYGRGGDQPTITDAHLVLGHLDPERPLGGTIRLDRVAAARAIEAHVARPLGMGLVEAAAGILTVANAAMVRAIEYVSIERGHDPREFSLLAFGGAAPLHATTLAAELGIREVVIPPQAGVLCALGTLCCDERYEVSRSILTPTDQVERRALQVALAEMESEARALAAREGTVEVHVDYTVDMRYAGQTASLEIPLPRLDASDALAEAHAAFQERYRDVFGYALEDRRSEIENARVAVWVPRPALKLPEAGAAQFAAPPRAWQAHFDGHGLVTCALYQVETLGRDALVEGPAVVAAAGSTALIQPGQRARVDRYGNLLVAVPVAEE